MPNPLPLHWTVGPSDAIDTPPSRFVPATVPGAVQLDWARAEGWPEYWKAENARTAYRWMEDVWWTYRVALPAFTLGAEDRLIFTSRGIDYACVIRIDGTVLHTQEGMNTPVELDLTAHAREGSHLEVIVLPAPKVPGLEVDDRLQARETTKPAVSYGWDWHPRLIPAGIWDDTAVEIRPAARLTAVSVTSTLDAALANAEVRITISATPEAEGRVARWTLTAPDGTPVAAAEGAIRGGGGTLTAAVAHPELWWPHDHGAQPLYRSSTRLDGDDRAHDRRIGFRRARLVMFEGAWDEPATFPKGRSPAPATIEINGREIFARGTNWVGPEIFPGTITADTYRPLLALARDAHMNLLRVWGGSAIGKESFYEQCDELGLMLWQEFPLSCNLYPDEPDYLRVLDQESRAILHRVREHPSLVLWCGGNELFNVWSGMTDQSKALRLLNANCLALDPDTPFIPTAPFDQLAHGDYRFRDEHGREVYEIFGTSRATAYTEFGCPGVSPAEYLRTFIPEEELWPPQPGGAWEFHHGFGAWGVDPTSWLMSTTIRHYFGEPRDLEHLCACGSWLQSEGYRAIFEEARRQKPRSSMALNWCFNEPWPSAANNSIVNWPARPKPAYAAVKSACRPIMASAKLRKFSWVGGEEFRAELWLLNDLAQVVPAGRIHVSLEVGGPEHLLLTWNHPASAVSRHVRGPEITHVLPLTADTDRLTLHVRVEGHPEWDSAYSLPYRSGHARADAPVGQRARRLNE